MRRKRLLALVLSLSLVMGMTPVTALAEGNGEQQEDSEVCICTVPCTEESVNTDCPVCGVEEADLSMCGAEGAETKDTKSELDEEVDKVQALIDALPAAEDLENMSLKEQQAVYEQAQAAYDEYDALTDGQKEQITGAEIFDALFAFFTVPSVMADDTHTCEGVENAVALTADGGILNEGNYYLTGDIKLTNDLTINGNVTLCLNGHVLTGSGNSSVITINSGVTFTLCDCGTDTTNTIGGNTYIGGVITGGNGTPEGSYNTTNGGCVYVNSNAIFTMNGGNIAENNVEDGGGGGGVYVNGTFIMNSGNIVNNYANSYGGGVYLNDDAKFTMKGGSMTGNIARLYGGGVYGGNSSGETTFIMEGGTISGNTADDGGGVRFFGDFTMRDGSIKNNTAMGTFGGYGGGVCMRYGGAFTMEGGEITGNSAKYEQTSQYSSAIGGGVFLAGGTVFNMKGGTIANNTADTFANGVYVEYAKFYMTGGYLGKNSIYVSPSIAEYTKFSGGYFADEDMAETYLETGYTVVDISADTDHYGDNDFQSGYPYAVYQAGTTNYGVNDVTTTYGTAFTPTVTGNDHNAAVSFAYLDSNQSPVTDTPTAIGSYTGTASFAAKLVVGTDGTKTFYPADTKTFTVEITKANQTAPSAPTQSGTATTNSFNIQTVNGQKYICTTDSSTPDTSTGTWIDGTGNNHTFSSLDAGTTYYIWTYLPGTDTANASTVSNALSVTTLPSISTIALDAGYVGVAYEEKLAATAAVGKTVTWELASGSTLPTGLTLSNDGTIKGTPTTTASSQSFIVQAAIEGANNTERISNTATLSITINAGTPTITADTYNGTTQTSTFTYGDTITITGSIAASTTAPGTSTNSIIQNQVGLYLGDGIEELATADVTADNTFTLTYDTAGREIPIGQFQTLTVKYGGSSGLTTGSATVSVTLKAKSVTAQVKGDITKVYDGDKKATVNLTVTKVNTSDDITVTAPNAVYDDANVGEKKVVILGELAVAGKDSGWYQVSAPSDVTGSITHDQLDAPANLIWNGTKASWDAVSNASGYSVTLYLEQSGSEEDKAVKKVTTDNTSYDFSNDITEAGSYYVSVTAKGTGNYSDSESGTSTAVTYYNVTVSSDVTGGSAEASPEVAMSGTKITLTTTADQGYHFWKWTTDPADLSSSINQDTSNADTWTFTMPAQHVSLTPVFEAVPNAPSVAATASGEDYKSGTWTSGDVTFTISGSTADSGIAVYQYSTDNDVSWNDLTVTDGRATLTVSDESATADGTEYLFRAVSEAGAAGVASDAFVVRIDKTSPGITVKGTNTTGYHQDAEITITPSVGVSGVSKVEVSSDNGSTWTDITDSYQSSYKVEANGTYMFRVTNGAGAMATDSITYNNIDRAAPVVLITVAAGGGDYTDNTWTNQDITLSVSNSTDNLGTTEYEYKVGSGEWQTYSAPITISDETDGTVYTFRGTSASGITSEEKSITVKLDKTAPEDLDVRHETNSFRQFLNNITFGLFFKDTVEVTISAADTGSGVDEISYRLGDGDLQTVAAENGTATFYVEPQFKGNISDVSAKDNAGNSTSDQDYEYFAVDSETPGAPEVSAKGGESDYTSGKWTDGDVTITLSGSSADSGIAKYQYSTDEGATWHDMEATKITEATGTTPSNVTEAVLQVTDESETAEGTTYLFRAVSNSKMEGTASEGITVKIDKTAPAVSVSGNKDAYLQSDTVKIAASTGLSGLAKVEVSKNGGEAEDITDSYAEGYNVEENGTYTFTVTSGAGVTDTAEIIYDKLDRVKPVVVIDSDSYVSGEWTNSDVILSVGNSSSNLGTTMFEYKVGDGEWQEYTDAITISDDTGVNGVTCAFRASSASGVESDEVSITVKVDKTAPTGEIKIGENGWKSFLNTITFGMFFKDTQTVSIDSADNLSGIAKVEYASSSELLTLEEVQSLTDWTEGESVDVTPEDGKRFIYYARITDNAGNVVCLSTDGAEYDLTAPVINGISDGGTYCISAEFTVSEKNLEEVQVDGAPVTARSDVYTLTPGEHIITVTDKADNSTQIRVTVNETHTPEEDDGDCTTAVRCAVCGKVTTPEQKHDFSGELKADESGHWYECRNEGCTVTSEKVGHSGGRADCVLQAVCDECGQPYGDKDPANHTNLVKTEAKPATHLAEGNTEYWYCDGCDKYFSDEAGTQEIALADTIIPKLAEHTADGTGWHKDEDSHWHTCLCGEVIDKADHTFEWVTDKEATSTEAGSKHEECAVCGYKKEAVEIPATGVPTEPKEPGKPSEPAEPSEPADPSEPAEPSKSNEPAETAPVSDKDTADQAATVATGYDSNIPLWVSLILASGLAIVGTAVYTRKKKYRR